MRDKYEEDDEYEQIAAIYGFPGIPAVRRCDGCANPTPIGEPCPKCDEPCPVFHRKGAGCPVCKGSGYVRQEKS